MMNTPQNRLSAIRQVITARACTLPDRDQRRVIARACTLHQRGKSAASVIADAKRLLTSIREASA